MHRFAVLLLLAASLVSAAEASPDGEGGRNRFFQRILADHPELKGVDPSTDEGKAKIQTVMQADMKKRQTERTVANHARLKTAMDLKDDEFAAVEPLLTKVETLRLQQTLLDPAAGMPGGMRGRGPFNPQTLLGDATAEPMVKAFLDSTKALKALVDDRQSNEAEITAAVARVRAARAAFQAALAKASEDLRGVLTPRQEALLIDQGTLE